MSNAERKELDTSHANATVEPPDTSFPAANDTSELMLSLSYRRLREQLHVLQELGATAGETLSPDDVHRARVATRRSRAALGAFKAFLPKEPAGALNIELRWFANQLAEIRDLDVYVSNFRDYARYLPPRDAPLLWPYELHLQRERKRARLSVRHLFESARFTAFMSSYEAFVGDASDVTAAQAQGSARVRAAAPKFLQSRARALLKSGRAIDRTSPATALHELRKRCKRFRYELELFGAAGGGELSRALKSAKCLQDLLGQHQDACVAGTRLRAYAQSVDAGSDTRDMLVALGRLMQSLDDRAAATRAAFPKSWSRFEKVIGKTDWKKPLDNTS